jgi:cytochrome b subunit of formate dehydrogenase/nitrate/TMAO reductase-like tetraheme cytochrome c subunit
VSLFIDRDETKASVHAKTACVQCHVGVSPVEERPCGTITAKVDCSICHAEVVETYGTSTHGKLSARGDLQAPACLDCHGVHGIKGHQDPVSRTYPSKVPELCGKCHREGKKAAKRYEGTQHEILEHYVMSIHGKGLLKSGLVVTAMCTDCHTPHHELPSSDPASTVHRDNIAKTCASCHNGIYERFKKSIHFSEEAKGEKPLPMCHDCHTSHTISRTDQQNFKLEIITQCGRCHQDVTEGYFETFHGKVSKLGYTVAAKCYDCHGAHDVLPDWNPESKLSRQNIVATCGKCHEGSHRRFAGYLTHATHHDPDKYPVLYYTFWVMSLLLIGVFGFFGIHTLMWLPRSLKERKRRKRMAREARGKEVQRFSALERRLHVLVVISFLGLVITGMTLKFSYLGWAQWLSHALGGFESAGFIHRVCALITFFYFGVHLIDVVRKKVRSKKTWREFLLGPDSMMPTMKDFKEFGATFKWFLGRGPRPVYGRWTYWEKFDYLAVFWGVAIIGSTGLVLWFPEFFTYILPGWFINVATIIHSDEALLAAGFIFTIHFFNTHFRPEKFPMDTVIFTGSVPLEEFKQDRRLEYEQLVESGELEERLVDPQPKAVVRAMKTFGTVALTIGIILIVLIIWAEVFGYR